MKKYEGLAVVNSKIFSFADCLLSFFPKGAVLSPILCVRFFQIRFGADEEVLSAWIDENAFVAFEVCKAD